MGSGTAIYLIGEMEQKRLNVCVCVCVCVCDIHPSLGSLKIFLFMTHLLLAVLCFLCMWSTAFPGQDFSVLKLKG